MVTQYTPTENSDLHADVQNESVPPGCIELRFNELEFLPWNNSENIVNESVERYARKVRLIMLQILFFIGGPGNVINMAVFFKQGLRERVNLLLFTLSLADAVYLFTALLLYSEELYLQLTEDSISGPVLMFIVNNHLVGLQALCFVSFVLSAIIACERCYCVLRPLKYQTMMSTQTMAVIIIAVYVLIIGFFLLSTFRYYIVCVYDRVTGKRSNMFSHSEFYLRHKDLVDYVDIIFFGSGLPAVVVMLVITATVITASRLRQAVAWRTATSSSLSPKEVALTKMLIGTSLLLIVCVSPTVLFRVARLVLPEMNTGRRNQNFYLSCLWISHTFIYINSSLNIFVYFWMGSRYRETFWSLFYRKAVQKKM